MSTVKVAKIALVVLALHLIVLGFFFYKPPVNYFTVVCFSTVIVWPITFSLSKRRKWAGLIAGLVVQVAIQQVAYHVWLSREASLWWPLVQFLALQYVLVLRLAAR